MSEPGIESRIAELVGSKRAFFTGLFDGTTDEVAFERSGRFLSRKALPEAASTLAALFSGMAQLLQSVTAASAGETRAIAADEREHRPTVAAT